MPIINFPPGPSLNDTYTFGGKTWVWNGEGWQLQGTGSINGTVIGDITPSTGAFTTLTASGNVTGDYFIGNGSLLTGIVAVSNYANANVADYLASNAAVTILTTGNISTADTISGTAGSFGNLTTTGNAILGDIDSNLLPAANVTYNLGSSSQRWNDLWLSNSTIYLGSAQISANGTSLILTNPEGGQMSLSGDTADISAPSVQATGNITGGNLVSNGLVSGATGEFIGNLTSNANISANYLLGNGRFLSGLPASYSNSDVANYLASNANITIEVTGNITTDNYFFGNGAFLTGLPAGYSNSDVANYLASSDNVTIITTGIIGTTANIIGNYFIGNGAFLTGLPAMYSNSDVANYLASNANVTVTVGRGNITTQGNITGGNLSATNITGTLVTVAQPNITSVGTLQSLSIAGNITTSADISALIGPNVAALAGGQYAQLYWTSNINNVDIYNGNDDFIWAYINSDGFNLAGRVGNQTVNGIEWSHADETIYFTRNKLQTTGNITGGNITTNGSIQAVGNITGGNLFSPGSISANGNITSGGNISGTYVLGNGRFLSGLPASYSNSDVANYLSSNAAVTITTTGNITGGNLSGTNIVGTLATGSQPNITSVGTLSSLTVAGNLSAGNLSTAGNLSSGNVLTGNIAANVVAINTSITSGSQPGEIGWNAADATYNMVLENGVVLQVGQEQNFWVIANGNINNGRIAVFAGASNNAIIASVANAVAPGFNAEYVIGVATQDIADGDLGYVTTYGKVRDINTNAFNVGDILYLSPTTPGGFTNVVPTAPNPKVQLAAVLQKGIANGCIVVRPTIFPRLENLQDVDASAVSNKDYLRFTTTGNLWQHAALDISDDTSPVLGGNLEGNNYNISNVTNYAGGNLVLSGAAYASAAVTTSNQLATKAYVDNAVSTGIHIHEPLVTETSGNLIATYADGGTTQTVDQISGGKTITFTASAGLAVNDVIVFTNSFNGITGGQAYFVYSTNGTNQITLSSSYEGTEITTLTNGGPGLAQPSRANSGVGATLTNAGANAALNLSNVAVSVNDRVLVYEQTNGFQNGVYVVSEVGNATTRWILTRSSDTNRYAPQNPNALGGGDYFFITNGSAAGESYVCNNEGVIIFGTTNIGFTLFSASLAYTGTSPVVVTGQVISLANTTGTGDTVVLASNPVLNAPNIGAATGSSFSATGNISGGNLIAASNVNVTGNINGSNITLTGNVTATKYTGATISVSGDVATGNIEGAGYINAVANVSGGNITTAGQVSAVGNVTGNYILGNGSQLTGISVTSIQSGTSNAKVVSSGGNITVGVGGTSNVAVFSSAGEYITGVLSATGNVTGNNLRATSGEISSSSTTGALIVTGGAGISGDVYAGGLVRATQAVQIIGDGANISSFLAVANDGSSLLSGAVFGQNYFNVENASGGSMFTVSQGNATVANDLGVNGNISAIGNITGDYLFGNGAFLSGISGGGGGGGNYSNANVASYLASNANITITTQGNVTANYFSGNLITRTVSAGVTSGNITPNSNNTDVLNAFNLSGNISVLIPTGTPLDGQRIVLRLRDDGNSRGITWDTSSGGYRAIGITLPTVTVASKLTYVGCMYNSTDGYWDSISVVTQV